MQLNGNGISIGFFAFFMALTLLINYWAARRTSTTKQFFAADGEITAWQNGWALAGDFLWAAALLGIAGIVTTNGFDGMIYSIAWLVGFPIMLFLIVEPLRNVGTFTFADVVAYRLKQKPVRSAAAVGTLAIILFYLIAQMVATGSLMKLLFGIPYVWSVIFVGGVMLLYVLFDGMLATIWVQVVKAVLLLTGGALLAALVLLRFDLNLLSPTVQVDVLGRALPDIAGAWWFVPLKNPAIVCMPLSFAVAVAVSLLTNEKEADRTFREMQSRMLLGPFASISDRSK